MKRIELRPRKSKLKIYRKLKWKIKIKKLVKDQYKDYHFLGYEI